MSYPNIPLTVLEIEEKYAKEFSLRKCMLLFHPGIIYYCISRFMMFLLLDCLFCDTNLPYKKRGAMCCSIGTNDDYLRIK